MIGFAFALTFGGPPPPKPADRWFARDKAWHAIAGAVVQGSAHAALRARGVAYASASRGAAAITLTVSVAKEWYDAQHPLRHDASWRDLAADLAGASAAAVVVRQADR
ncbi:MAG: hypothetical protein K2X99_11555 [Gemmatimonadaceae bacterium]|nr:hypothetical protein [Gemmatimonadaceae bacterium]